MRKTFISLAVTVIAAVLLASCSEATPGSVPSSEDTATGTSVTTEDTTTQASTSVEASETTTVTTDNTEKHTGFNFNPHVVSDIYIRSYGEDFKDSFFRFCDATLEGADSVALKDDETFDRCRQIIRTCLPVADNFLSYGTSEDCSNRDGTYKIFYTIPREEYLVKVKEFKARVEELVNRAYREDDTPLETILALYQSESERISYDYDTMNKADKGEALDEAVRCNPYHTLMYNDGICQQIAGAYAYLLLQVGIDATTCSSITLDREYAHEWTVVKIGDDYYHCDVTAQCVQKGSLSHFGMTDDQRQKAGDWDIKRFNFGFYNEIYHEDFPISDKTFAPLWESTSFKIDRDKDMLYCYGNKDSKKPYFKMSLK